jgi:hypothetical protein
MVYNATFNNILVISRWSVLFVEEIGVPGENYRCFSKIDNNNFLFYYNHWVDITAGGLAVPESIVSPRE